MYIARILYPVKALGPGDRIGIWFAGCTHYCKGCSNPELWETREDYKTDKGQIMRLINSIAAQYQVDGFTITGGDPFEQPESLLELLPELRQIADDVLVYTGYEYEQIKQRYAEILDYITVLIDGLYIEELNDEEALRGSTNQRIIVLDEQYVDQYNRFLRANKGSVQNFITPTGTISVGIHRPGYEAALDSKLSQKGLIKHD